MPIDSFSSGNLHFTNEQARRSGEVKGRDFATVRIGGKQVRVEIKNTVQSFTPNRNRRRSGRSSTPLRKNDISFPMTIRLPVSISVPPGTETNLFSLPDHITPMRPHRNSTLVKRLLRIRAVTIPLRKTPLTVTGRKYPVGYSSRRNTHGSGSAGPKEMRNMPAIQAMNISGRHRQS